MKKSIFLFFAAILCAMTANAQLYLRGGFNNWNDLTADYQFVSNVCNLELPGGTTYEFKIADSSWGTQFGGNLTFTATATKTLTSGGGNMKITTTIPGTYRFEFVQNTKKLTVTYPEIPAPHDITVRAQVPAHWTNDIYAHVWTSENGSGQDVGPLTKNGDYYEVTKNAGALYVIFKNGSAWSNPNQTVDLCYTEDVCLQLNQSGSAKATATVIDCGAVSKDITVKAVVPGAWENTITAWVWPTGGEGEEVTPTKEGNWYVITKNCIELNVIFKNGTGWNGNENQTANIAGVSENTCYQISALNKDGEGKCTYTVVDCEAAIEPEAKPVDVYTIVGAETLVGTAWDLNNTDNDMTKQDDGSYVLVKENVELATTGTYEYKVAKNRGWDWKGVNEGNNLTLTGVDVDGTYNVTFTLNKELNALTASLELVEAKKVIPECYVAGDESLTGQNWNAKSVLMTYDEATEVYTATLTAVPAGTHNMKVVYGGEWLGFDHLATPAPANVKEGDDKKIQFTLAEAGNVTVTYHATNGIGLTGNFAAPVTYDYYIAGTLAGGWSATQQGMTKDGDVYKHTFSELNADTYEFKITDGQFNSEGDNTHEHTTLGAAYEEVSYSDDGNIKIVTEEAINLTVIFDATADKITFEGLTEKAPEPTFDYYICGSFNSNNPKNAENGMTLDGEVYKATVTLAAGDNTLKVTDGTWDKTWGANELGAAYEEVSNPNDYNNIKITLAAEAEKNITVIFDATAGKITFEGLTPYVAPLTYTVTVPEGTEKCFIAGPKNVWDFQEMELVTGETNKFTITIVGAKETDQYKYACQADWAYAEVIDGGGNRTQWTALDEVTAWNAPAEPAKCYLMGNGDWENGVEMTLNPENDNEFVLLCHHISAPFKFKYGETWSDAVENYDFPGIAWGDGNIELPEGDYDFYYKKDENKVWIGVCTPATPTPDYTRTTTAGNFGTICLPFGSTNYTGATFYEFVGSETGKVYLGSVTTLEAGVPYIFEASAAEVAVYGDGTTAATPGNSNGLHGTFTDETPVAAGNYILLNNELRPSDGNAKVNANRAYIVMSEVPTEPVQQMPGRRYIGMKVQSEGTTTGFENITTTDKAVKVIENGQLIIIRDGVKYNAQGVKL